MVSEVRTVDTSGGGSDLRDVQSKFCSAGDVLLLGLVLVAWEK